MASRTVTNLERFLCERYNVAHDLLLTDPDGAERVLLTLLEEPRLPLWIRAQSNMNLAFLADDVDEAASHLNDARLILGLFKQRFVETLDQHQAHIAAMEHAFDGAERDIAYRREHPEEEDVTHADAEHSEVSEEHRK